MFDPIITLIKTNHLQLKVEDVTPKLDCEVERFHNINNINGLDYLKLTVLDVTPHINFDIHRYGNINLTVELVTEGGYYVVQEGIYNTSTGKYKVISK